MNRREFASKVAVVGLSAPVVIGPVSALATNEGNNGESGSEDLAPRGRIRLRIGNRTIIPIELRIVGGGNVVARINLKQQYNQTNEKRGFIKGISKPTIRQRFAGAQPSGQVRIYSKIIYVVPTPIETLGFDKATVVNNGISWAIGRQETAEYETVDKVPVLGDIPVIGSLFRQRDSKGKSNILIAIEPTLIEGI